MNSLPKITQVVELCLDAKSLSRSISFYSRMLGPPFFDGSPRMAGFALGSGTTLLLFQRGLTTEDSVSSIGRIPGHGLPVGNENLVLKTHFAFGVDDKEDVDKWEEVLKGWGVKITGKVDWPRGGKSVYFEDPDEHVGEICSRKIWPHY